MHCIIWLLLFVFGVGVGLLIVLVVAGGLVYLF